MTDRILVIDDEPDAEELFRQHFRHEIRRGQFKLVFANSGERALELLSGEDRPFASAIFSDIKMPGMSGLDVLINVHDRWPDVPVYMITAFGGDDMERNAMDLGAQGFFTKPLDFEALGQVLDGTGGGK